MSNSGLCGTPTSQFLGAGLVLRILHFGFIKFGGDTAYLPATTLLFQRVGDLVDGRRS
jgi:hypothetical protein